MRSISALIFVCFMAASGQSAFSQSAQSIAAAKKEGGRTIVYTSMETFTADAIKAAFEKRLDCKWNIGAADPLKSSIAS